MQTETRNQRTSRIDRGRHGHRRQTDVHEEHIYPAVPTAADNLMGIRGDADEHAPLLQPDLGRERSCNCWDSCCFCITNECISSIQVRWNRAVELLLVSVQGNKKFMLMFVFTVYGAMALCKLIGGAVKVGSECPFEKMLAYCLFVKGWLAGFFWVPWLYMLMSNTAANAMDNRFVMVYTYIDAILTMLLLVFGTVLTTGFSGEMGEVCPTYEPKWGREFLHFGLTMCIADWVGVCVFIYTWCYIACWANEHIENEI